MRGGPADRRGGRHGRDACLRFLALLLSCSCASRAVPASVPDHVSQPVGPPPLTAKLGSRLAPGTVYRVEPSPDDGFHWPYFLAVPEAPVPGLPLLVQPNNDGRPGAPFETHLYWASVISEQAMLDYGNDLGMIALTPAFPRPALAGPEDNLYVHALTRAAMQAENPALARPDLQLLGMIEDARERLGAAGHSAPADAVFWGFSAAGDFVTRMAFLHPERVRAVVAGGIGGLPMLPLASYGGDFLTYPLGVEDIEAIGGRAFQAAALRKTPMLLFQGAEDDNDSVPEGRALRDRSSYASDSYDYEQARWVNETLGPSPVDRVEHVQRVFDAFGMEDFAYRIVADAGHDTNPIEGQVRDFIACILRGAGGCARENAGADSDKPAEGVDAVAGSFCDELPRPEWAALEPRTVGGWFELAEVAPAVWALYEPWQWQEVISYLVVGEDSALLFDTGNGIGDIRGVVRAITDKPLRVLNSHSHYDHVGGNHQFAQVLAPATDFSRRSAAGLPHGAVADEVSSVALCRDLPDGAVAEEHRVRPYTITGTVSDGDVIDLGGIALEVVMLPGHTPDALGLLDRERGYFWSGDSFYEGPIWLFMPETDLDAYRRSVAKMAAFAPQLTTVFPSHNTPRAAPQRLVELREAVDAVVAGELSGRADDEGLLEFTFPHFSLLLAREQLDAVRSP